VVNNKPVKVAAVNKQVEVLAVAPAVVEAAVVVALPVAELEQEVAQVG